VNITLGILLAAVALWMVPAFHVKPLPPQPVRVIQPKVYLPVDCTEKGRICRMKERLEKIKGKQA
jgi:hypothetical protein